jgi:Mg/Co/Ni transporter MgtE
MTIEYVELKKNMTVKEALEHIKKNRDKQGNNIYMLCYGQEKKIRMNSFIKKSGSF